LNNDLLDEAGELLRTVRAHILKSGQFLGDDAGEELLGAIHVLADIQIPRAIDGEVPELGDDFFDNAKRGVAFIGMTPEKAAAVRDSQSYNTIIAAATALVQLFEEIEVKQNYMDVWVCAHNHGVKYRGPTYEKELNNLRESLRHK
jgi:hypothetical protein